MNKQSINALVIDKKKMKIKDANLPDTFNTWINSLSEFDRNFKYYPIVKAKIGSKIMVLICDNDKIFNAITCKKEQLLVIDGIRIMEVREKRVYTNDNSYEINWRDAFNTIKNMLFTDMNNYDANDKQTNTHTFVNNMSANFNTPKVSFGNSNEANNTNCCILIKNEQIASQFYFTFLAADIYIDPVNSFMINNNEVFLFNNDMEAIVKIDLLLGEVYNGKFRTPSLNQIPIYNVIPQTVASGMCNMIVNALAQWIGGTPYIGPSVCQKLSNEASDNLRPYCMKLVLTTNYMKIYKHGNPISYSQAIKTVL